MTAGAAQNSGDAHGDRRSHRGLGGEGGVGSTATTTTRFVVPRPSPAISPAAPWSRTPPGRLRAGPRLDRAGLPDVARRDRHPARRGAGPRGVRSGSGRWRRRWCGTTGALVPRIRACSRWNTDTAACVLASLTAGRATSVATGATVMAGLNSGTVSRLRVAGAAGRLRRSRGRQRRGRAQRRGGPRPRRLLGS